VKSLVGLKRQIRPETNKKTRSEGGLGARAMKVKQNGPRKFKLLSQQTKSNQESSIH
jgi:hypothetical protein